MAGGLSGKKVTGIALLMAAMVAVSAGVTAFTGVPRREKKEFEIVTSFYPVYIAALNLTDGIDEVETTCLTQPQTGCLHNFQLSPDHLVALGRADLLVINGAGAESFLSQVSAQFPALPVLDTSGGIDLLESGHAQEHAHTEGEEEGAHTFLNEHFWTSPTRYIKQVENLRDGLIQADPEHAGRYRENAAAYLEKINEVEARFRRAAQTLPTKEVIIFHDSLAYFAKDAGLQILATFSTGEDSGLSASALAEAQDLAGKAGKILLLYDSQYPVQYDYVGAEAEWCRSLCLDMGIIGQEDKNAWLAAMEKNLTALEGLGQNPT